MEKNCGSCEFNFGGICAGHGDGDVYQYGEKITDDTKCCSGWGESFEYFEHKMTTAPRFLRDPHNACRISYQEFSKLFDDYNAGIPVAINIFDAIKYIYGISMVDIAVVLGVTYGVVYRAKTQGIVKKRIAQFANALCVPEKFLFNVTTDDFEELTRCKDKFFSKTNINEILTSMPNWKEELAQEISAIYVHCPIHIAKSLARVDYLYWNEGFSLDEYTESEQIFINYIARKTKKYEPVHHLEYFLNITCHPHMETRMLQRQDQ